MSTKTDEKKKNSMESGNLEQVRDILFGKSVKEFENRFKEVQKSFMSEIAILREDNKKMFNSLENYVKTELNSIEDQMKSEIANREEADRKLADESNNILQKLNNLEKQFNKANSETRSQLLELNKKFSDEISDTRKELFANLNDNYNDLQNQKADRSKLATLLTEMAIELSDGPEE